MSGGKSLTFRAVFAGVILAAIVSLSALAQTRISGTAKVVDGDSLVVSGTKIRLGGIDAPEWKQMCLGRQAAPCGQMAAAALRRLIEDRPVSCAPTGRSYDRTVATCYLDGEDLGRVLVRLGWAVDSPRYSGGAYAADESAAREAARGAWEMGGFIPPWEWRQENQGRKDQQPR